RRFPNPRALMAFLGLIPSEDSSGDRQKGGSITKAGNRPACCRQALQDSIGRIGTALCQKTGHWPPDETGFS
ncbi:MAG: IS110 family transposase, partial [Deltaproteobacteria bacterium]|nr:IS110 family transposase [Deltaproteobacteria bacterium]